jgi:hypothetical protein
LVRALALPLVLAYVVASFAVDAARELFAELCRR